MPVEKLDVVVEVFVQIAAADQRPTDRTDGVDREREEEEDNGSESAAREPLEPGECSGEPVSCVLQAQAGFRRR